MTDGKKKLLIVEDSAVFLEGVLRVLEGSEFAVTAVAGVAPAQRLLKTDSFDILLTDLRLVRGGDGGEGLELIRWVREQQLNIPIVLMTTAPELVEKGTPAELGFSIADKGKGRTFLGTLQSAMNSPSRKLPQGIPTGPQHS